MRVCHLADCMSSGMEIQRHINYIPWETSGRDKEHEVYRCYDIECVWCSTEEQRGWDRDQDIFFKALTFNIFNFINVINVWLHWVFVAVCGLSLAVVSGDCSLVVVHGFSLQQLLLLHKTGFVVHGLGMWFSCPMACGIFLNQGSNPCPLHWQVDS